MTREEIEKLPGIVDTMLGESVTEHVEEKLHEKITEVCNLAIKALEQEPCEDAISRAWIKESIHNLYHYSRHTPTEEDIQEYIVDDALPVTPKQKMRWWIPVSERLPEGEQSVLFCDIDGDIMVGYHVEGRPDTHFSQDGTFEDMKNVKAWMPLPEPYKAESEDRNGTD